MASDRIMRGIGPPLPSGLRERRRSYHIAAVYNVAVPPPKRETIANVARLRAFMDRHRLAAVVARSGQNFTYLSGLAYPGTLARHLELPASVGGVLLVWPRDGQPVLVLNKIGEGLTRRASWVERIEVYDAYTESPYRRLAQVLGGMGLGGERVGFEKSYVSAAHWDEVQRELPSLQMVDCAAMMDEVRWVKTEGEIRLLKKGADLLDDAYLEVFPTIEPGETERAVHSRLIVHEPARRPRRRRLVAPAGAGDLARQQDRARGGHGARARARPGVLPHPGHGGGAGARAAAHLRQVRDRSDVRDRVGAPAWSTPATGRRSSRGSATSRC